LKGVLEALDRKSVGAGKDGGIVSGENFTTMLLSQRATEAED
jgi:hypothetical protein